MTFSSSSRDFSSSSRDFFLILEVKAGDESQKTKLKKITLRSRLMEDSWGWLRDYLGLLKDSLGWLKTELGLIKIAFAV